MKVPHKGLHIRAYILTGVLTLIAVFVFPQPMSKTVAEVVVATPAQTIPLPPPPPKPDYFESLTLTGQGIYVFDLTSNTMLFEKNKDIPFPLASITKLMTAVVALEMYNSTSTIPITEEALSEEGDTGLLLDEKWNLADLLAYTLVVSSNDGATAIASSMGIEKEQFIERMNEKARALSLSQVIFHNETGLDETAELAGGYGTAQEVSKLLGYALRNHPEVVSMTGDADITVSSADGFSHYGKNTNILTSTHSFIKAGKTGYSRLAGGNLALIFTAPNNHDISIVVLGSNYDDRFRDVETLLDATVKTLSE